MSYQVSTGVDLHHRQIVKILKDPVFKETYSVLSVGTECGDVYFFFDGFGNFVISKLKQECDREIYNLVQRNKDGTDNAT